MRLKLVAENPESDPTAKGWRLLERGEMTLGRGSACDWTLADPDRTVSSVHCRITRDAQGFLLRDESTNGVAVDGRDLVEGQAVRLSRGSVVEFCGHRFKAEITGEVEPDWEDPDAGLTMGDEMPSVTAILADVAPVGRTATGILPGRSGDDWLEAASRSAERTPSRETPISRAEIGWAGPPATSVLGAQLPDDWNLGSDGGSRNEHVPATSIRVRLPKTAAPEIEAAGPATQATGPAGAELVEAFLAAAGLSSDGSQDPLAFMTRMGRTLRDVRAGLARLDAETRDFVSERGVEWPNRATAGRETVTILREVAADHARLLDAMRAWLGEVHALAPRAVEARPRTAPSGVAGLADRLPLPGFTERQAWRAYCAAYEGADGLDLPGRLSAKLRASPHSSPADDFEELSADRPRHGDAE